MNRISWITVVGVLQNVFLEIYEGPGAVIPYVFSCGTKCINYLIVSTKRVAVTGTLLDHICHHIRFATSGVHNTTDQQIRVWAMPKCASFTLIVCILGGQWNEHTVGDVLSFQLVPTKFSPRTRYFLTGAWCSLDDLPVWIGNMKCLGPKASQVLLPITDWHTKVSMALVWKRTLSKMTYYV